MTVRIRVAVLVMLTAVLVASTSIAGDAADRVGRRSRVAPRSPVVRIRMVDDRYRPRSITISRGTRVRWVNRGVHVHSVAAKAGTWGSPLLNPGDRWGKRFRKPGTYAFYCTVHPAMTGTITVT